MVNKPYSVSEWCCFIHFLIFGRDSYFSFSHHTHSVTSHPILHYSEVVVKISNLTLTPTYHRPILITHRTVHYFPHAYKPKRQFHSSPSSNLKSSSLLYEHKLSSFIPCRNLLDFYKNAIRLSLTHFRARSRDSLHVVKIRLKRMILS